jgi:hypothetical protein
LELYNPIFSGMYSEIAGKESAFTGALGLADLPDDNLAGLYFLAAKYLNAEALARTIMDVFTASTSFDV